MKNKVLFMVVLFVMGATSLFAQTKTAQFLVNGNCGMCQSRIEKAAKAVPGVSEAAWSKNSKMMIVSFDSTQTTVHKVQMAIANVGHDTPMHKSTDAVYAKLPGCCQYDRSAMKAEGMKNKEHLH